MTTKVEILRAIRRATLNMAAALKRSFTLPDGKLPKNHVRHEYLINFPDVLIFQEAKKGGGMNPTTAYPIYKPGRTCLFSFYLVIWHNHTANTTRKVKKNSYRHGSAKTIIAIALRGWADPTFKFE